MRPIALVTDSCCDLPAELAASLDIEVLGFPFTLDGEAHVDDLGATMPYAAFYDALRAGAVATTAQITVATYLETFRRHTAEGRAVVCLTLSSALSGTHDAALLAQRTLAEESPDAEVHVVDTRCASIGLGLLVLLAAGKRDEAGMDAAAFAEWARDASQTISHNFTVESLEHLRRGGRISDVAAAAGAMLDIKPVLHVDGEGALFVGRVVRGRKRSLRTLADLVATRANGSARPLVLVGHADAPADAEALRALIAERLPHAEFVETGIGPVIGSHVGPGMVAAVVAGDGR